MTAALHVLGGEWVFDAECDCPRCEDWRDGHCPNCHEPFQWDGDMEKSRVCASCRADEAEAYREDA